MRIVTIFNSNYLYIFALISFLQCQPATATDTYLLVSLNSTSYSEPVPIKQLLDNLEGENPDTGDIAFTHNAVSIGIGYKSFEFSFFKRYDYHLSFNRDTIDLIYADENDQAIEQNRRYDIHLKANHIYAQGIKLAYAKAINSKLKTKIALSYIDADQLIDGSIKGTTTASSNIFQGNATVDYNYTDDVLFDRQTNGANGKGYAVDIYGQWQINNQSSISLSLEDLFNEIRWKNVPYTNATLNTNTVTIGSDGTVNTLPALSGVEGFRNHTQSLPIRSSLQYTYQFKPHYSILTRWQRVDNFNFPSIGLIYHGLAVGRIEAIYNLESNALGVHFERPQFSIGLHIDQFDIDKANALSLSFSYRLGL
ncbi:MAG: hypothetical protein ACRBCI_13525 [Cellvibrionaceae bacterium]